MILHAKIKIILPGARVTTPEHADYYPPGHEHQIIRIFPVITAPEWYRGIGYDWHSSWLIFSSKELWQLFHNVPRGLISFKVKEKSTQRIREVRPWRMTDIYEDTRTLWRFRRRELEFSSRDIWATLCHINHGE